MRIYILFLLFVTAIYSSVAVDISNPNVLSVLESSEVCIGDTNISFDAIQQEKCLRPYSEHNIHVGEPGQSAWIHFILENTSENPVTRALVLNSPSLGLITLHRDDQNKPRVQGIATNAQHDTIYYTYTITLPPHSKHLYWLRVSSDYMSFYFNLTLQDDVIFRHNDLREQALRLMLLGVLLGLMVYAFLLAFYSRGWSYLFYGIYLFFILWQQVSFLGLTPIYFPHWFVLFDIQYLIPKIGFLILSSIVFSISYLKVIPHNLLFKIYIFFVLVAVGVITLATSLKIVLLISVVFMLFNFMAGVIIYRSGQKQARLFVAGFGVVSVAYLMIISDSFGLSTFLDYIPNILLWATTIEALLLMLAFADRYRILQEQKDESDRTRETVIQNEVIEKTAQLKQSLHTKELLLKEIHHRVKNNLQIILSMIRLQRDKITDFSTQEKFLNIENRINAIAKTYNILIVEENLEYIDMDEYIEVLLEDIKESMLGSNILVELADTIRFETDIDAELPLSKAVYLGIIINELVTNACKHAFGTEGGIISVSLHEEKGNGILIFHDDGRGFSLTASSESLGLKLIRTLIIDQLHGSLEIESDRGSTFVIRFPI